MDDPRRAHQDHQAHRIPLSSRALGLLDEARGLGDGHMWLCQGVVAAWRNPRAHRLIDDSPTRALMMLEVLNDLIATTKAATRTRQRRTP